MKGKFFLDTNIFVYAAVDDDLGKSERAAALIEEALITGRGVVSYQVVQEFFNVATKRLQNRMKSGDQQEYLRAFFGSLLQIQSSLALYFEALQFKERYQLAWYDSLVVCAAIQAECTVLYSEDMQHGQRFGTLEIQNPFL
jgi:predicted nucleic acid-binding protein